MKIIHIHSPHKGQASGVCIEKKRKLMNVIKTHLIVLEAHWMVILILVPDGVPQMPLFLVLVVELVELVPAGGAEVVLRRPRGHARRLFDGFDWTFALAFGAARFEPTLLCVYEGIYFKI